MLQHGEGSCAGLLCSLSIDPDRASFVAEGFARRLERSLSLPLLAALL